MVCSDWGFDASAYQAVELMPRVSSGSVGSTSLAMLVNGTCSVLS